MNSTYFSLPARPFSNKASSVTHFSGNGAKLPDLNTFISDQARKRYQSPERQPGETNHEYQGRRLDTWTRLCDEERAKIEKRQKQQHLEVPSSQRTNKPGSSSSIWGWLSSRSASPAPPKK